MREAAQRAESLGLAVRHLTAVEVERETGELRVMVRRIFRKYGYPPDKQEKASQTV